MKGTGGVVTASIEDQSTVDCGRKTGWIEAQVGEPERAIARIERLLHSLGAFPLTQASCASILSGTRCASSRVQASSKARAEEIYQ